MSILSETVNLRFIALICSDLFIFFLSRQRPTNCQNSLGKRYCFEMSIPIKRLQSNINFVSANHEYTKTFLSELIGKKLN